MFTGLVEATGRIAAIEQSGEDCRLRIEPGTAIVDDLAAGDSISVAGACLTAVDLDSKGFWSDVSAETLAHTTLGDRLEGDWVNLERSLLPTTRLGGHLVTGHVDGVGEIVAMYEEGQSWRLRIRVPDDLARYVAPKGSICIDGISLTVNDVAGATFGVNIIPHTFAVTTLGVMRSGDRVNIEVDLLARYLERLLQARQGSHTDAG